MFVDDLGQSVVLLAIFSNHFRLFKLLLAVFDLDDGVRKVFIDPDRKIVTIAVAVAVVVAVVLLSLFKFKFNVTGEERQSLLTQYLRATQKLF